MTDNRIDSTTVANAETDARTAPVRVVARGPKVGAAVGGGLVMVGGAVMAIPFPLPWIGPLVGAVLMGVGAIVAALNGAEVTLPPPPPPGPRQ